MRPYPLVIMLLALSAATSPVLAENEAPPEQDDGGSGADASSSCQDPSPVLSTTDAAHGNLYPPQDKVDFYGLDVTEADVGHPVEVVLRASSFETYLDVFLPDCGRNVIASSPACGRAPQCADGHKHLQGRGHAVCARGHAGDEACDTEQGSGNAWQVTFTPSRAGVYGVRVAIPANAADDPKRIPPDEIAPNNCHQFCFDYDLDTSGGPATIE